MKKLCGSRNPADAHLIKGLLEAEGIEVKVLGEFLWGARGEIPVSYDTAPTIWLINDNDYDRAKELLEEYWRTRNNNIENEKDWICSKCGESNEALFTECWNCGTSRK